MLTIPWKSITLGLSVTLSVSCPAAADSEESPPRYTQHCVACHAKMTGGDGALLYQRKDRMVRSISELEKRVRFCQQSMKLDWNAVQQAEVVNYLNRLFYHFPP